MQNNYLKIKNNNNKSKNERKTIMKTKRRIIVLALAAILVLGLVIPAFATENDGKGGTIKVEGVETAFANPRNALDNGVAMVHQELNQVLRRNVMENVWLGRFPTKNGFIDSRKMYHDTQEVFKDLEIDVDPRTIIGKLSVSQRQMIEIAKAVSYNAKILVLDEPTSSLTENEVEHLFKIIEKLTAQGVGIIYISHKMDEILRISHDVTIMRDEHAAAACRRM